MTDDFGDGLKRLVSLSQPVDALCVIEHRGFWVVAIARGPKIRVYSFSQTHVEFSRRASHETVQELLGSQPFIALFRADGRAFALDIVGGVHWLCPQDDDEGDMFDTEAVTGCAKWFLVSASGPAIPPSSKPLAACPFGDEFIIVAANSKATLLYIGPTVIQLVSETSSAAVVFATSPGPDFSARWLSKDPGSCAFIGLSEGSLFAFSPALSFPVLLSKSIHAVRTLHFDRPRLLALFENGALYTLGPAGEIITFPLPPLLDACILVPLAASDGLRLLVSKATAPLPGITALIPASGDRFAALTADSVWLAHAGRLRLINTDKVVPTVAKYSFLAAGAARLKAHAAILSARSLGARPLHWSVNIRVAQLLESRCVLRVRISLDSPGAGLPSGWMLHLRIEGAGGKSGQGESILPGPLVSRRPSTVQVIVDLPYDILISVHPSLRLPGAPPLILPSSLLDACNFLLPPTAAVPAPSAALTTTLVLPGISPLDLLKHSRPLWRVSESAAPSGPVILCGRRLYLTPTEDGVAIAGENPFALAALKISALLRSSAVKHEDILLELVGWYQANDILRYSPTDSTLLTGIMYIIKDASRYA